MNTSPRIPPDTDENESVASGADLESLVKDLRSDMGGIRDSFKRTLFVEWHRLQARVVDACFRAGFGICVLAFGVAAALAAAVLIAMGLYKAIVLWTGVEWIGGLGAGFGILAIAFSVGAIFRSRLQNQRLDRTKRALARSLRP